MGFIESIKAKAFDIYYRTGILPSLSISQAILESGRGESGLTKTANNLFGYKGQGPAGSVVMASAEYDSKTNTWSNPDAAFRAYNSIDESFEDYAKLISTSSYYKDVVKATDWKSAVSAIDASPYATDPDYGFKLSNIIVGDKLYELDTEAMANKALAGDGSNWGGTTGGSGDWSSGASGGTTGSTRTWGADSLVDGISGFFNLNPNGTLANVGEWFKSSVFVILGILFLGAGIWFLFGTGGTVVNIASDVLKEGLANE